MNRFLKMLFFGVTIKPVILILLGLNRHGTWKLPTKGPAAIIVNQNSHLDTVVLMGLYPLSKRLSIFPLTLAHLRDFLPQKRQNRIFFVILKVKYPYISIGYVFIR